LNFAFCILHFLTICCAVAILPAANASAAELQWRSNRSAAKKPSNPFTAQRFVQPRRQKPRVDIAVRQATFEEDGGPQLTAASEGEPQFRSIVVDREELPEPTRSAQLPQFGSETSTTDTSAQPDTNSGLEEQLRDPFGESTPQLPGIDTPGAQEQEADAVPSTQGESTVQPTDQQPFEPAPGPFQPILPPAGESTTPTADDAPAPSAERLEEESEHFEDACEKSLTNLQTKTIGTVNLSISVTGTEGQDFPFECTLDQGDWHAGRAWPQTTYLWKASALCHKPLYFEDEQLERYGHSWPPCCQPFVSGAHFFTRLPVLPYCMGVEPPHECVYALGHYRPGSCAPYMCNPIPLSPRGALFQAGAVVGAAAVLP
jgi:hypothetical protein